MPRGAAKTLSWRALRGFILSLFLVLFVGGAMTGSLALLKDLDMKKQTSGMLIKIGCGVEAPKGRVT